MCAAPLTESTIEANGLAFGLLEAGTGPLLPCIAAPDELTTDGGGMP